MAANANMGCEKKTSLDRQHNPGFLMDVNDLYTSSVRQVLNNHYS